MPHKRDDHGAGGERGERRMRIDGAIRRGHERRFAQARPDGREHRADDGDAEHDLQRTRAKEPGHRAPSRTSERYTSRGAWPGSGGWYSLECRTIRLVLRNEPSLW